MTLKENIQLFHGLIDSPTIRWNFSISFCLILFVLFTFQMTMKGSKLALFLLLVVTLEILLFTGSDGNGGWKRRRRRPQCRWSRPSYPRWDNNWRQDLNVRCGNSKKSFSHCLRLTYILCFIYLRLLSPVSTTHTSNELMIWLSRKLNFVFTCLVSRIKYCERTHGQNCRLLNWMRDRLMSH